PPLGCSSTASLAAVGDSNITTIICRDHITKYGHAALTELASNADFAFSAVNAVQLIEVGGDVYYAAVSPVKLPYPGIGVWLALVMPEADVIGDVVTGRNTAIGVTCGVFVLATAATFVAIALLLRPLSTIADRMMLAATLEDDGSDDGKELSSMAEVEDLQQAYYAMNEELNRIKSFVPQTVLQKMTPVPRLDATNDDARETSTLSNRSTLKSVSTRRGKGRIALSGAGALNVLCGVAAQYVTVVAANLSGFEEAASSASRDAVVQGVADTVRLVHEAAAAQKGVVQSFHGDHFVVTFNAVTACAAHARRGAVTALQLVAQAPSVGLRLPFRAGVATGKCLVGNLGSSEAKTFNTIGPAYVHAGL
ncbi:adenylate/guanylate cyclase domain-containing protein, partial [Ralstonia sp.]|uniref:adenylate/guanylate cyclase domain-containing protein n=1 Tax=Ralstonia sp. TaxID=54061 RepID=UPI0025804ABA